MAATTTPRKRAPRKAAAPKAIDTPAEAAAAEALNDGDVEVEFRGQKFVIKAETLRSARFRLAVASGNDAQMVYELLASNPFDEQRLFALADRGEDGLEFFGEFFAAYAKASGQGNS